MRAILQAVNDIPLRISLRRCETLMVCGSGHLRCENGELWLTESDSGRDSILATGQQWRLRHGVDVVLSTAAGACLCIHSLHRGMA